MSDFIFKDLNNLINEITPKNNHKYLKAIKVTPEFFHYLEEQPQFVLTLDESTWVQYSWTGIPIMIDDKLEKHKCYELVFERGEINV